MSGNASSATREMGDRLNEILLETGQAPLSTSVAEQFGAYGQLLLRWNARTNLTAIRDEDSVLRRHFAESIACARLLPAGITSLLDFGSGAGFPGLPIALCRREITVTLAESQNKKAAFLREAARVTGVSVRVHGGRAEALGEAFDCVTLRAVDRMEDAVRSAVGLVAPGGWLAVMTMAGLKEAVKASAGIGFEWSDGSEVSAGAERLLLLARRAE